MVVKNTLYEQKWFSSQHTSVFSTERINLFHEVWIVPVFITITLTRIIDRLYRTIMWIRNQKKKYKLFDHVIKSVLPSRFNTWRRHDSWCKYYKQVENKRLKHEIQKNNFVNTYVLNSFWPRRHVLALETPAWLRAGTRKRICSCQSEKSRHRCNCVRQLVKDVCVLRSPDASAFVNGKRVNRKRPMQSTNSTQSALQTFSLISKYVSEINYSSVETETIIDNLCEIRVSSKNTYSIRASLQNPKSPTRLSKSRCQKTMAKASHCNKNMLYFQYTFC